LKKEAYMDKRQLKQVTTKVYEEYGFVKIGKCYYLDLDNVIVCSGFASVYDITFLMYNFSIKAIHNDEERKLNNTILIHSRKMPWNTYEKLHKKLVTSTEEI
jgi:hypothetical protein